MYHRPTAAGRSACREVALGSVIYNVQTGGKIFRRGSVDYIVLTGHLLAVVHLIYIYINIPAEFEYFDEEKAFSFYLSLSFLKFISPSK